MSRRRHRGLAALLAAAAMLAGCAAVEVRPLEPALFPPPASTQTPRDAAVIALSLAVPDQSYTNPPLRLSRIQVQLPVGRMVEAAARLALSEQFGRVDPGPPRGGSLALRLSDVAPEIDSALIFILPGPWGLWERVDVTTRLAFRLTVSAPDGSVRWSQAYDSTHERLQLQREGFFAQETLQAAMQRRLHEQAARLAREAAAELRHWLDQERQRERVL